MFFFLSVGARSASYIFIVFYKKVVLSVRDSFIFSC
jgi:hypothetical protein